jgi:pimeloyl-[acyl-carrier protein] methyl ester esterase
MELVFIHGWGCDASFWDPLAGLLSEHKQQKIERGYFGSPQTKIETGHTAILIGHSLGFMYGLQQKQDWAGWIAINSFPRFVQSSGKPGCVHGFLLGEMRRRFAHDPQKTLAEFYKLIGENSILNMAHLNQTLLLEGLDELREYDMQPTLSDLAVPSMVLASRNDPLVPENVGEALTCVNSHARLLWHETGGHMLPHTDPAWCANAVNDFIKSFESDS